ncbi:ATP-binding protein [Hydrogenophaga sp.]|uniref:sensor histidine kinase n=1 Tax=Hydrogenophaga sp. TaxID=1904254 RepID=UPI0019BEDEDF|nr:ATP-binding protein [Hydrogenophaga sp.]MBD3893614.1 PAS domain S-box protein [Hydrogenophaga sp.]
MAHEFDTSALPSGLAALKAIAEHSGNMVVLTDRQRRIVWVNQAYTRGTGWTLADCAGKRAAEFLHGPLTDKLEAARLSGRLMRGESISNFELTNYKKSGEPFTVSINIDPVRERTGEVQCYISIQSDVSQRRQSELELAQLRQRLEQAQRLAGIGRIEPQMRSDQTRWSSQVFRLLGQVPDEEPRSFSDFMRHVHPDDLPALERSVQAALETGDEVDVEFRVLDAAKQCRWVRCRGVPHAEAARYTLPRSWMIQDISSYRQRMQDESQRSEELERTVQARTHQLQESNRALEAFSYSLAHDLRSPLRHMTSFAELLKEGLGPAAGPDCQLYCDKIVQAAARMHSLVDGMLSFARLGNAGMHVRTVDVNAVVREVVQELKRDFGWRPVVWRIAPDLPLVSADPVLLREVWVNLLNNALKYSAQRERSEVEVGWRASAGGCEFWVRDNGVGFNPDHAGKLFGMFQRLHRELHFEGTGIGLALVRRIVEGHGGRVWASSQTGQGACFYVFLPQRDAYAPVLSLAGEAEGRATSAD